LVFLTISQGYWGVTLFLAFVFALYPILLFIVLLIYAFILNPIREWFPNSWFTRVIIKNIDKWLR
jgi:hypothetical protein